MAFLDSLFLLFSGDDNPESKKKRALKQLGKEINQNKYRKFYKVRAEEICPEIGVFFYDMYKIIAPAQAFLKNSEKSNILKQFIVEAFLSQELQAVYQRLSADSLEERAKTFNHKELSQQLQQDLHLFSSAIRNKLEDIDRCYNLILAFIEFVSFDFFSIIKKFDPRVREQNFSYQPQFRLINGKYLLENLKDFLDLASLEATQNDWKTIFEILKNYKGGKNIIDPNQWKKLLSTLQDVHKSNMLVLMVRYIEQNPKWQRTFHLSDEYMAEAFIKAKEGEVAVYIDKIEQDKRSLKQDALAKKLFGDKDNNRLQYYTNTANEAFTKKDLEGFTHIRVLNYLKGFLEDYFDVRELCDLFLIRGQWKSQELSRQISQGLHDVTNVAEELTAFDETLAEKGTNGSKLRGYLAKSKMDKGQITSLKAALIIINGRAKEILDKGIEAFSLVGNYLKDLSEDYGKGKFSLLVNWKEIESVSERPIAQRMEQSYKIIESFVLLLQLFSTEEGIEHDL